MSDSQSPLAGPEAWNLVSPGYVSDVVPQFEPFANDALDLAEVAAGTRVVDVAAGPGTLSLLAATRGARVSALDFAPVMIEALQTRAAEQGASIEAQVGNGMALPYADASFDAGFSMFGLMFFPDRHKGFSELARVLRPGGRAVVSSWQPLERVPLFRELMVSLKLLLPNLPFGEGSAPLGQPDEMIAEMRASGFEQVEVHEVSYPAAAPSLAEWWSSMQRSMAPLVVMKHRMDADSFRSLSEGVYARMVEQFGEGPQENMLIANLGVGTCS